MLNKKGDKIDWVRNVRFTAMSGFIMSPLGHYYTAAFMPLVFPVTNKMSVLRKLLFDQTGGATFFLSIFFVGMSLFEGKRISDGVENLKAKYWISLRSSWLLWPIANGINFAIVPIKFQVLYTGFVSLFWNIFLSYAQNAYKPKKKV